MKHVKRIIGVILVIALFAGSYVGSFYLFSNGTYFFNTEYLSVFEEQTDCYYLQKADRDIIFRIDDDSEGESGYSLQDSEGNPVQVSIQHISQNSYDILPPEQGYTAGERYTLTLSDNAYFHNEDLKNARKLVFCIDRENVESYEFTDKVIEVDKALTLSGEDRLDISNLSVEPGDIVFGQDENDEYVVYKVTEILEDNTAAISIPALDEIYSELEVYNEYIWNVDDLVSNPDIEVEIVENVKQSSFFNALIVSAYADDKPRDGQIEVKIAPDRKDNSVEIEISILLEPGEKGLFGVKELKNQQVSITLKAKLRLTTKCNIKGITNWDLSASLSSSDFSWTVDIGLYSDEWKNDTDLEGLFSEKNKFANLIDYHKKVRKITEKLNEISADVTGGEIKLFDWKIPVPSVPGLYFRTEIKLFAKLEIAADVVIGQENDIVYTVGICFVNNKFNAYSNIYREGKDVTLSLRGKAKAKTGIKLVVSATVISKKVANISIDPQAGLYAELYVTWPVANVDDITDNNFIYCYFEPGVYFSANIEATLNVLMKKFEFSYELYEKKFPIDSLTYGNKKIALGISANAATVRANDNIVTLPEILFEYYDVKRAVKATEKLSYDDLKFVTNDGTTLKVSNGKLTLPDASFSSSNSYIAVTYLHTDGKTYSTIFRVLVSGSTLEGKVSGYTPDLSAKGLEGANVKLYAASDKNVPISSIDTDENGRFAFNVPEGNYFLVISAEGYRTLTTNQKVGANEIKYTEHILLMDSGQSGMGTAGGTVTNALDGKGLSDVRLRPRTDWNNTTGTYYADFETFTSSTGSYTISDIPVGYYTLEATLNGYVTGYFNIMVLEQNAKTDFDFTITPVLTDDNIRIVLTWGSRPSDLDSHLIGRTPSNEPFNVYYSDKVYTYEGIEMANLDVDDTTSYGPETVTILKNIYGVYTYAVHNFTNRNSSSSNALSLSGAVVKVFMGSVQITEYHVPTDQIGTYWTVFQIDGKGNIIPINMVSNTKPEA